MRKTNKILLMSLLLVVFAFYNTGFINSEELPKSWIPKWKVGDWWVVNEIFSGRRFTGKDEWTGPTRWKFTVIDTQRKKGKECFVILINSLEKHDDRIGIKYYEKETLKYIGSDGSVPVGGLMDISFPIEIDNLKLIKRPYKEYIEKKIDKKGVQNILYTTFPEKLEKSIWKKKPNDGRGGEIEKVEIRNVPDYIISKSKILPGLENSYYYIRISTESSMQILYIFSHKLPWPVISGIDGIRWQYLEDYSGLPK